MNAGCKVWGFYKKTWHIGALMGIAYGAGKHGQYPWSLDAQPYAVMGATYPLFAVLWAAEVTTDLIDRIKD